MRRTEPWAWGWARPLLLPLSWAYGLTQACVAGLRSLRPPLRPAVPVISVGNLSVGGTGKSPLVRALAIRYAKKRPAILLRGHGSHAGPRPLAVERGLPWLETGDEALEHARRSNAKVWIGADRAASAALALGAGAGLLILDDGFQRRWQLARDLDLICADYAQVQAGEALLPAGPWREPWKALEQAQAVLIAGAPAELHGKALAKSLPQPWAGKALFRLDSHPLGLRRWPDGKRFPLSWLKRRKVSAFSGLGRPERFEADLQRLGAKVSATRFGDHHVFSPTELAAVESGGLPMICTYKDSLRLDPAWTPAQPLLLLEAEAVISPAPAFWSLVDRAVKRARP